MLRRALRRCFSTLPQELNLQQFVTPALESKIVQHLSKHEKQFVFLKKKLAPSPTVASYLHLIDFALDSSKNARLASNILQCGYDKLPQKMIIDTYTLKRIITCCMESNEPEIAYQVLDMYEREQLHNASIDAQLYVPLLHYFAQVPSPILGAPLRTFSKIVTKLEQHDVYKQVKQAMLEADEQQALQNLQLKDIRVSKVDETGFTAVVTMSKPQSIQDQETEHGNKDKNAQQATLVLEEAEEDEHDNVIMNGTDAKYARVLANEWETKSWANFFKTMFAKQAKEAAHSEHR